MKLIEKISKSSWALLESSKDVTSNNLTNAIRNGQLKIESSQVAKLLALVEASIDEGYHKGVKTFLKSFEQDVKNLEPIDKKKR